MAKKTLLEKLRTIRNLESAWQTIQENGRSSKSDKVKLELEEFAADAQNRLRSLQRRLACNTFEFPPAIAVPIPKDKPPKDGGRQKIRPIVLAPVESRIVQRALLNVLLDIDGLKPYVKTEFSFGGIRSNRPRQATERPRELSSVPAAIQAVLNAIERGGRYVACADISSFFTRIRYIDDFIIVAPTLKAANARLEKAIKLLKELEMTLSEAKSSKKSQSIEAGFDFLGIHLSPGIIRPSDKAREKFLEKINNAFREGQRALIGRKNGQTVSRTVSLLGTLKRVDGTIDGWAKHYWFCNDGNFLSHLDEKVSNYIKEYLGAYKAFRNEIGVEHHGEILGVSQLKKISRTPFKYSSLSLAPLKKSIVSQVSSLEEPAQEATDDVPWVA